MSAKKNIGDPMKAHVCENCGRYQSDPKKKTCGYCDKREKHYFEQAFPGKIEFKSRTARKSSPNNPKEFGNAFTKYLLKTRK